MEVELKQWLAAAKAGDQSAEQRIFQHYQSRLMDLVYKRLPAPAGHADGVIESVMRTFFKRLREDRVVGDELVDLWPLLARITARKVCRRAELPTADPGPGSGPGSGSVAANEHAQAQPSESSSAMCIDDIAREPTLEDATTALGLLEQFLSPFNNDQRRIVALRLEGNGFEEISQQVGCSESIARIVIDKLKQVMKAWL